MTTRAEALRFIEDSRRPDVVPEITDRVEKIRRLGLKSDDRSVAETSRVVALLVEVLAMLPPGTPFPVQPALRL